VVVLAQKDSIINSGKIWRYLRGGEVIPEEKQKALGEKEGEGDGEAGGKEEEGGPLRVVWCANMDHGQIFDLAGWRGRLKGEVIREARLKGMPE